MNTDKGRDTGCYRCSSAFIRGLRLCTLVLDADSTEDGGAADDQALDVGRIGAGLMGLIAGTTEDADDFVDDDPVFGHAQFKTAEDGGDFDNGGIGLNLGAAQI